MYGLKQWLPYFHRTFESYAKLWKYQQTHRAILDNKERYGLKRYEIGEIASMIGQLYYHYYLRTSDVRFLLESCIFYESIRSRGYFRDVMKTKSVTLVVKVAFLSVSVCVCVCLPCCCRSSTLCMM